MQISVVNPDLSVEKAGDGQYWALNPELYPELKDGGVCLTSDLWNGQFLEILLSYEDLDDMIDKIIEYGVKRDK